jgi:anti-sigma factor RsiW
VSQPTRAEFQRLLASGALFEEYARMVEEIARLRALLSAVLSEEDTELRASTWDALQSALDRLTRLQQGADQS